MRRKPFTALIVTVTLALFAAGGGTTWAGDFEMRDRIQERLQRAGLLQKGEVVVDVEEGTAVLLGYATTLEAHNKIINVARKEAAAVENRMRVVPEESRSGEELLGDVRKAILGYAPLTVFDSVGFALENGHVVLEGSVSEPYRKKGIERRVAKVPGVVSIDNRLSVQPESLFDDRLRVQLYRTIYGSSHFARYAHQPHPPIRIVVERGRVTLTGAVLNRVEQTLVGILARESAAFRVNNEVELDGARERETAAAGSIET